MNLKKDKVKGEADAHVSRRGEGPNLLMIEVTNRCNARCSYCPRGANPQLVTKDRYLTEPVLRRALECAQTGRSRAIWLHHSGEPFLHQDLPEIVAAVRSAGFFAYLSTNFIAFSERRLREVLQAGLNDLRIHLSAGLQGTSNDEMFRRIHEARRLNWELRNDGCRIEVTYALVGEQPIDAMRRFESSNYFDNRMYIDFYRPHDWPHLCKKPNHGVRAENCRWLATQSYAVLADGQIVICCLDQFAETSRVNILDVPAVESAHLADRTLCRGCLQQHEMEGWLEIEGLSVPTWLARRQEFDSWT